MTKDISCQGELLGWGLSEKPQKLTTSYHQLPHRMTPTLVTPLRLVVNTPLRRSGMARVLTISQFYLHSTHPAFIP